MIKGKFLILATSLLLIGLSNRAFSQESSVKFDKTVHDFGDILLSSGNKECTFTFENISTKAIIVQTVITSCGCTKPIWTKSPVLPGEKGEIKVTFLNDQGPYPFNKSITVYITNEPKPIVLRVKGVAHQRFKTLGELFPIAYGGLSLNRQSIDFGTISKGEKSSQILEVANRGGKSITVSYTNLTKGLTVAPNPLIIKGGEREKIVFTLLEEKNSPNWGKSHYNCTFVVDGKRVERKFTLTATVRENFNKLTKEEKERAPLPMASASTNSFKVIKQGSKVSSNYTIKNLGKEPLVIYKIESDYPNLTFKYPKSIGGGESGVVTINLDSTNEEGERVYLIYLVTNSPNRPIMNLILKGKIEK